MTRIWPLIVRAIGGVHEFGRFDLIIHDRGVTTAWDQIVTHDWWVA